MHRALVLEDFRSVACLLRLVTVVQISLSPLGYTEHENLKTSLTIRHDKTGVVF